MPLPNPPFTLETLLAVPTADTIRGVMVSTLVRLGIRADLWPKGGAASSVLTDVAEQLGDFAQNVRDAIAAFWLPTATGGWLAWLAFYFYGLTKQQATFASGSLTLTNGGGGIYSYAPGEATFANTVTKKTYVNVDAISLGIGATQTIAIQATDQGSGSNANPGEITTLVTSMLGVTANNLAPVLGLDAQSDDNLRQACWDSLGARSVRGPRTAYQFAIGIATNSDTGGPVNINRYAFGRGVGVGPHTGQLRIWVASPDGAALSGDVTGANTSVNLVAQPQNVTGPAGGDIVAGASTLAYGGSGAQIVVWVRSQPGLVQATVQEAVASALSAFLETYQIGGLTADGFTGVHGSGVDAAIGASYPGIVAIDLPDLGGPSPGDLTLSDGFVAVNNVQLSDIVVRIVSQ